jgi:aspartyl-tRNA(Asn)/glutamyl-tRNA(Gln) amidotransferase subunit C
MHIDETLIFHLEKLSRLQLAADEREKIKADLNNILAMVEKLDELDLTDVPPLTHITERLAALRTDEVRGQVTPAEALRNAPDHSENFFRVPKVIPQSSDDNQ